MPGLVCPGIKEFSPNPQNLNESKTGDLIDHLFLSVQSLARLLYKLAKVLLNYVIL